MQCGRARPRGHRSVAAGARARIEPQLTERPDDSRSGQLCRRRQEAAAERHAEALRSRTMSRRALGVRQTPHHIAEAREPSPRTQRLAILPPAGKNAHSLTPTRTSLLQPSPPWRGPSRSSRPSPLPWPAHSRAAQRFSAVRSPAPSRMLRLKPPACAPPPWRVPRLSPSARAVGGAR